MGGPLVDLDLAAPTHCRLKSVELWCFLKCVLDAEHEDFTLQFAQHGTHRSVFDNPPFINNCDIAAQRFGFLEIMGGQNDRGSCRVDLTQEVPHRTSNFDIDTRGRLIENQQSGFVDERPCDHQAALHSAGQRTRLIRAPVPQP